MAYNSTIHGLVTRGSSETAKPQNPLGSGLRQCYDFWVRPKSYAATKPKARSPMGFFAFLPSHMRYVGGVCRPDPYTSTPEGSRWAKNRAGWYVERLRARALFASSLFNAMRRHGSGKHTKADTVSLRYGSALLKQSPRSMMDTIQITREWLGHQ